jgi:hypothetical protein
MELLYNLMTLFITSTSDRNVFDSRWLYIQGEALNLSHGHQPSMTTLDFRLKFIDLVISD